MAKLHQNKEISKALEYAIARGFRLEKAPGTGYARLFCPFGGRGGHIKSIFSTPRVPENLAESIVKFVDKCEHWTRPPA